MYECVRLLLPLPTHAVKVPLLVHVSVRVCVRVCMGSLK
jgi:hypothetical protein